jgi:hypothetical protein
MKNSNTKNCAKLAAIALLSLLGSPLLHADKVFRVTIDTTPLAGTSGYIDFNNYGGIPYQNNVATITHFASDAVPGGVYTQGDFSGTLVTGPLTLTANAFDSEWLQAVTFGTTITFTLDVTTNYTPDTTPDSFSFFLLDSTQLPFPSSDPSTADSAFSIDLTGGSTVAEVYTSTNLPIQFTAVVNNLVPDAVFRNTYGAIELSMYASSTLSNSGGVFASDPSAAQDSSGNTFVAARDTYNSIWANVYNPNISTWSGWQFGAGIIQGVPAIAVDTSGTAWIASRDTWNSYWLVSYTPDSGFGSWIPLEGIFSTDPVVTACGDGSIYLIGKDNWSSLWSAHYIPGNGGFQGWVLGGGIITGKPAATCGSDNNVYVVGEDSWNSNWMVQVSGNEWSTWYFGGAITSVTPRIAALGNGSEAVVILDMTGVVYSTTYTEGTANGWQPWAEVGGILADVAPAGLGEELYLVGKSPTGDLWWWQQTGNQWTWIGNNGVAAGALAAAPR